MSFEVSAKYKKNKIYLNFSEGVVSTGGTITILDKNNKKLESIELGSKKTSGGIYSLKAFVHDYPYNWIALDNDEIFGTLAKHDNKKLEEKTSDDWAFDLRTFWNVSIGGKFYRLDQSTTFETSSDEWYNYHSTTPEYTPKEDKSGHKDIVLTPLGGIKELVVKPNKKTKKFSDSLKIDISDAGLMSASGDLSDYLDFEQPIDMNGESKNNTDKKNSGRLDNTNLFQLIPGFLSKIKSKDKKGWNKNVDVITGDYEFDGNQYDREYYTELNFHVSILDIKDKAKDAFKDEKSILKFEVDSRLSPFSTVGDKYDYPDFDRSDLADLKVSSKKYFKRGWMNGQFTITLSDRTMFFEEYGEPHHTMTATFVNDLL